MSFRCYRLACFSVLIVLLGLDAAPSAAVETQWIVGSAAKVYDLVELYDQGSVQNAMASESTSHETSGGVTVPGIFLHPLDEGKATWSLQLRLPSINPDEKLVFLGLVGLRDGIPWGDLTKPKCDGVDFSVNVGAITCISVTVDGPGWVPIASDFTQFQGQEVNLVFSTSCRADPNYDWATIGRPEILILSDERYATPEEISENRLRFTSDVRSPGVVLVVEVVEPSDPVALAVSREGIELATGRVALPIEKGWIARRFEPPKGKERINIANLAGPPRLCSVYHFVPTLRIEELGPTTALPLLGKNFFSVRITNTGPGYYQPGGEELQIHIRNASDLTGEAEQTYLTAGPPELAPGQSVVLRRGPFQIDKPAKALYAVLPGQSISAWRFETFYSPPSRGAAALACGPYRVSFPKYGKLYPAAVIEYLDPRTGDTRRVGTIAPLATATYMGRSGRHTRQLATSSIEWLGERDLVISESVDQVRLTVRFSSDPDKSLIRFSSTLKVSEGEVEVFDFSGPRVAFGDKSFGADHGYALFPGLEYLGPEDYSSSELDAADPVRLRYAPDPIKITIPLMAVEHDEDLVCMFWDPYQDWYPGEQMPGARFNVPPNGGLQDYSSFGLYAPPPPRWRPENSGAGSKPVVISPDRHLSLSGVIYLEHRDKQVKDYAGKVNKDGVFILNALKKYIGVYGLPDPMKAPRDWESEKNLSRQAWLSTIWVPEEKGWRHAVGENWRPAPAPGMATLLLFDRFDTQDPEIRILLRDRINLVIDTAIQTRGPGYLSSGDNCHIMRGEYPFYGGHLEASLEQWMLAARKMIREQHADGSWEWRPGRNPRQQNLGSPGQATSGICAGSAWFLLRLGRILGDDEFVLPGLSGLEALEKFNIPRGAQGWECPLHAPDILAAAYAVFANVEAYRVTGESRYLEQARYWAWSGLPFVYLWNVESIPSMRYNTIPIFGATFYTHPWFGRPVIWCGLVYAYALQQLAAFDTEFNWRQVAEGITNSAMWQQYEFDHKSKGCYPDSYDLRANKRNPADINPEDIMVNAFALRGLDPGIKTRRVPFNGKTAIVSSGAAIEPISGAPGICVLLSFFEGETTYTLLSPITEVVQVLADDRDLPRVEDLQQVPEGYRLSRKHPWLIVKTRFDKPTLELRVHWPGEL